MIPDLPGWDSLPAVTRYHNWAEMAGIIAVAFLVLTEIVAYKYGHRKDDLTEQQQTTTNQLHDEEMARLHLETAQANARGAEAQLALEKYRAPRAVSSEQQTAIVMALQRFAGQKYALSVAPGIEPARLLCILDGVLRRAGWVQQPAIGSITVGTDCGTAALNSLSGIDARRGLNATPETIAALNALGEALAPTDAAVRLATDPINNLTTDVIILMVGAKQ